MKTKKTYALDFHWDFMGNDEEDGQVLLEITNFEEILKKIPGLSYEKKNDEDGPVVIVKGSKKNLIEAAFQQHQASGPFCSFSEEDCLEEIYPVR